jgi:hypothetical protein
MDLTEGAGDHTHDAFALVEDWFGPGGVAAWYLLILSIILTWADNPYRRVHLSADFLAAVAYPVVAACYLLARTKDFPAEDATAAWEVFDVHYRDIRLRRSFPDSKSPAFPKIIAIDFALRTVEIFLAMAILAFLRLRRKKSVTVVLLLAFTLCCGSVLALAVKTGHSRGLAFAGIFLGDMLNVEYAIVVGFFPFGVWKLAWHAVDWSRREERDPGEAALWCVVCFGLVLCSVTVPVVLYRSTGMIPGDVLWFDSGIPLTGLGQAAGLAVGVLTCGYNIFKVWRDKLRRLWRVGEDTSPQISDEEWEEPKRRKLELIPSPQTLDAEWEEERRKREWEERQERELEAPLWLL